MTKRIWIKEENLKDLFTLYELLIFVPYLFMGVYFRKSRSGKVFIH